jgi:hypothetical protein
MPRCRPRGLGIGHSRGATSVEVEPVEITTRVGEGRLSKALAMFFHSTVTVPPILGIMRAGRRGKSPTRRRFLDGTTPDPIAATMIVKISFRELTRNIACEKFRTLPKK